MKTYNLYTKLLKLFLLTLLINCCSDDLNRDEYWKAEKDLIKFNVVVDGCLSPKDAKTEAINEAYFKLACVISTKVSADVSKESSANNRKISGYESYKFDDGKSKIYKWNKNISSINKTIKKQIKISTEKQLISGLKIVRVKVFSNADGTYSCNAECEIPQKTFESALKRMEYVNNKIKDYIKFNFGLLHCDNVKREYRIPTKEDPVIEKNGIKIFFQTSKVFYSYIFDLDPLEQLTLLYPRSSINRGENRIHADFPYYSPANIQDNYPVILTTDDISQFSKPFYIYFLFSEKPIKELHAYVKRIMENNNKIDTFEMNNAIIYSLKKYMSDYQINEGDKEKYLDPAVLFRAYSLVKTKEVPVYFSSETYALPQKEKDWIYVFKLPYYVVRDDT